MVENTTLFLNNTLDDTMKTAEMWGEVKHNNDKQTNTDLRSAIYTTIHEENIHKQHYQ